MNDSDELKARSVELAERALRLRDRANDSDTKQKLHAVNNELINLENRQRFYDAQIPLEIAEQWTEDQRSLAHEMSVADRQLKGIDSIGINVAISQLIEIVERIDNPSDQTIVQLSGNLQTLIENDDSDTRRRSVEYVLRFIEDALQKTDREDDPQNELADTTTLRFRNIRDSLLVHRELLYDEDDLLKEYKNEGEKIERLGLLRHQLDELYRKAD